MIDESLKNRHEQLSCEIEQHNRRYYLLNEPTIDDRAYDLLFKELIELEAQHPGLRSPESPTQRVGSIPLEGFVRAPHPARMYSLDNTYDESEIGDFLDRVSSGLEDDAVVEYVVEPKLDGASMELIYRDGVLTTALTRGDGVEGEDVTSNIKTIRALPLKIAAEGEVVVRGEVFINRADLDAVNQRRVARGEAPFSNPRNAAAGSLRLLDPSVTATRPLRIFIYELVLSPKIPETQSSCLELIDKLLLPVHHLHKRCRNKAEVLVALREFDAMRATLPFEIDGAVIKVDKRKQRETLGYTSRFPRWAAAYKFEAEQAETVLREITVQVGRTGALTPVAILDPVQLAGSIVARASLHNEDEIRAKDIREGDTVIVEKAGEIIPQVVSVIQTSGGKRGKPFQMPTQCPICKGAAARIEGEAKWRCTNRLACPGQLKASLRHFAMRSAMDVEHLGPSIIDQLVDNKLVHDPADLFSLSHGQITDLERMGEKSADRIIAALEAARKRSLDRMITGLGVPLVGTVAASMLAQRFGDLQSFAKLDAQKERDDLAVIHGIGPKIADAVAGALEDERFMVVVNKFLNMGINPKATISEASDGPLVGMSFCMTGKLSAPRTSIQDKIRKLGGEVHSSVKKGTTYLIIGEKVGKSKIEKAQKAGTKVIDESSFKEMLSPEN